MHALESDDVEINTDPKNSQRKCYVKPEAANIYAMLTRVELVENENNNLKKRVEIVENENSNLKKSVNELTIKHESMNECFKEFKESIKELKESKKELKGHNKDILKITEKMDLI